MGCFASLVAATVNDRILFSDGIWWFFNLIKNRTFVYDAAFTRYADLIFQIPALAALHLGFDDNVVLKLYSLMHNFNPFVSLLFCGWILKKRDRLELLIFPILSFATVTQATLGDPSGMVSSLLSFTWPLFFLTVLKKRDFLTWFGIVGLVFCFAFEHESGVIFLLMLTVLESIEAYTAPADKKREHFILCGLFLLGSIWLVYRVFGSTAGTNQYFVASLLRPWDSFRLASSVFFISALLVFFKPRKISSKNWLIGLIILVASAAIYTAMAMQSEPPALIFWNAARGRTTGVFYSAIIGFCCFVLLKLKGPLHLMKSEYRVFLGIVTLALAVSLAHDIKLNTAWQRSTSFIKSKISAEPGCLQLSERESGEKISHYGFYDALLPLVSIVMSKIEYGTVGTVLYSTEGNKLSRIKNVKNFCCLLGQGKLYFSDGVLEAHAVSNYDLAPAVAAAKANAGIYGCDIISE